MAATNETYYFGQGKVWSRPKGGTAKDWVWWGDVSALTFGGTDETASHQESYSGYRAKVRSFSLGGDRTLSATLHQIDPDALARLLRGTVSTIAAGTVTAEALPHGLVAGDVLKLEQPFNVSDLVITDSSGSPVTVPAEHYELDAAWGTLTILSLPAGLTQPLQAAYQYAGGRQVSFFSAKPQDLQWRYEGINLAENNAPVLCEFYKVSTSPLEELALITDGTDVAGVTVNAEALLDSSRLASGPLGQFGRFVAINQA